MSCCGRTYTGLIWNSCAKSNATMVRQMQRGLLIAENFTWNLVFFLVLSLQVFYAFFWCDWGKCDVIEKKKNASANLCWVPAWWSFLTFSIVYYCDACFLFLVDWLQVWVRMKEDIEWGHSTLWGGEACTGKDVDRGLMWLVRCGVCQEEWLNGEIREMYLGWNVRSWRIQATTTLATMV